MLPKKKATDAGAKTIRKLRAVAVAAVLCSAIIAAAPARAADESTALTIYSTATPGAVPPYLYMPSSAGQYFNPQQLSQQIPGYAIVKQQRPVQLQQGRTTIRFTDVAAQIDPTTVRFKSLSDPEGTSVLEQNFEFDLVSTQKLMERYIDRKITVEQVVGDSVTTVTGTLLSTSGGLVLANDAGEVLVVNGYRNVQFPELPGGLITRPTLVWNVLTNQPGQHDTRVTYETKAITWWADYNVVFTPGKNANSGLLDIGAWVSIINKTGASFPDAKLKLIAGDVNRAPQPMAMGGFRKRGMDMVAAAEMRADGFEEKSFFEYHLYTLGRPTTLPDNSTKQLELFPAARSVPCEKVMVYYGLGEGFRGFFPSPVTDRNYGTQSNEKVDIYLRFKNEKERGMGMPLPSGRIRVSQRDEADDSLEFIGEDTIDHTPKDEEVLIKLGSAFDVVGERKQTDFAYDSRRDRMDETIEIKLRNHKDERVRVIVKENLYRWVNWEVIESSHKFDKHDARTIHFPVTIEKDGEVTVTYKVRYTW